MLALLLRIATYVGHALALVLGISSLLFILLSIFGYALGYGHAVALASWLVVPFVLPLIAFILLLFLAVTRFKHLWWLGSIGLFALTCVTMFGLKDVGSWVYLKMNQSRLEQAVSCIRNYPSSDGFALTADGAYCLGISLQQIGADRDLLESLHADVIIRHGNCIFFSVDGMMTWHRGVAYSLDGNPPPQYGDIYYYNIAAHSVGDGWYVYDAGE